ncbi:MAG: hypothetical protein PHI23_02480 [Candidatus Peribacteraceae bacterium]|nr:hypothetical protein [Candidatus Peribacteraceae bacterium]
MVYRAHTSAAPSPSTDALGRAQKFFVLPQADPETPGKVKVLQDIATQHSVNVPEYVRAEDNQVIVTFRGEMQKVINAAVTVSDDPNLKEVFATALLGDYSDPPCAAGVITASAR